MHRGKVRALVGTAGWSQNDPLTVAADGTLVESTPATDVTVAYALQDGIAGQSAWVWWPPDNQQVAPSGP